MVECHGCATVAAHCDNMTLLLSYPVAALPPFTVYMRLRVPAQHTFPAHDFTVRPGVKKDLMHCFHCQSKMLPSCMMPSSTAQGADPQVDTVGVPGIKATLQHEE